MKDTSVLAWKCVKSIIHPPLPMSPRDSRHLLSLLKTSFTEALDKEHPKVSSEGRNSTDEHVHSILSSPIFGPKPSEDIGRPNHPPPSKRHTPAMATESSKSTIHGPLESISIANAMIEFNVKSFRNSILTGRADLSRATACLRDATSCTRFIHKKYGSQALEGFGKHGMASMMMNWLWSSGLENSDEVLLDPKFLLFLSPFLVAEGRFKEAMEWFQRLGAKANLHSSDTSFPIDSALAVSLETVERFQRRLLVTYPHSPDVLIESPEVASALADVRFAFRNEYYSGWQRMFLRRRQQAMLRPLVFYSLSQIPDKSLNTAISIFVQAITSSNVAGMSPMELVSVFRPTGNLIVKKIQSGWKADQSGYDSFSSTLRCWNNTTDSFHYDLVHSVIKLHDPNNPDWEAAYLFLSKLTSAVLEKFTLGERRTTVSLGLDTSKILLSSGKSADAHRAKKIMECLQQHFGDELGVLKTSMGQITNPQYARRQPPIVRFPGGVAPGTGQREPMETDFALIM